MTTMQAPKLLVLDCETYFDREFSLKKMTIPEYVCDARFVIHGIAVRWPEGRCEFRSDLVALISELRATYGDELERVTVVGHNLAFDLFVLARHCGLFPQFAIDTMLLAYEVHGRRHGRTGADASLASLATQYGLTSKGDLGFMLGVRHPDARQMVELADYARHDANLTYELALRLLPQVSRPEVEVLAMIHALKLFTRRGARVDVAALQALGRAADDQLQQCLTQAQVTPEQLSRDRLFVPLLTGALAKSNRSPAHKEGKRGLIPAVARKDEQMQQLVHDADPAVATLAKARLEKKSYDQLSAKLKTLTAIVQATGGYLPVQLTYCGAHTGRFAGGGGFNLQNLGRDGLQGRIRGLLVPEPGHQFVVADLAQIEARVTAWLAGEQQLVTAFANGQDVYSQFATRIFGEEVRKPTKGDPKDVANQLIIRRQLGKACVLGLGFGMGALTFHNQLRSNRDLAAMFTSGELDAARCHELVQLFRETYPGIATVWKDLDEAAWEAVYHTGMNVGPLVFRRCGADTVMSLPSGRLVRYPRLRQSEEVSERRYLDAFGQEQSFTPTQPGLVYGDGAPVYGGLIFENAVQAIARDCLVESLLRIEARGLPVLFHVHDEVIVQVPESQADAAAQVVKSEMERSPEWADGLPIAAEVAVMSRYAK